MEKKSVGIATVYTGFNYGSSLQAFATKALLEGMGYNAELLKLGGSIIPGRDVRIKKTMVVLVRSLLHSGGIKSLKNYGDSIKKPLSAESKGYFNHFTDFYLQPRTVSYKNLKKEALSDKYKAFLCGSDQVWNSAVFYVDPFYYLRFAPQEKRIAFAPSFGRDFIPDYNKKKIKKYLLGINHKSVRESTGKDIVKDLTGDDAQVLVDPTLALSAQEWSKHLKLNSNDKKYLLAYFLDKPSEKAINAVKTISEKYSLEIIGLPCSFDGLPWAENVVSAGPREFVEYVKNASFVCTDSFHGTAFSLNFNIPFYTFERNYGNAGKQSARIESVLQLVSAQSRYEPASLDGCLNISFENVNKILSSEREKAKSYLSSLLPCRRDEEIKTETTNNVLSLDALRSCTGCSMCGAVCPMGAVTIKESPDGFYTPDVDNLKCTQCGLCKKICYKFDKTFSFDSCENYTGYSASNKKADELKSASSGGVSAEIMREALNRGYFVAGVAYDVKTQRAVTKIAKTDEEIEQFKGSKYFQSYTADCFREIVDDKSGQKYAIFGTPCQIYAFSRMSEMRNNRDKYLLVDIFCHGCPGLKLWDKYLDFVKNKKGVTEFEKINFRSKTHGWHEYCFDFFAKDKSFSSSKYNDPFHEMFFGLESMNKACYDCVARSSMEKTDIRIGDFWGKRFDENVEGVSAVITVTEKGKDFFESVKDKLNTESADFNEIVSEQSYKKVHRYNECARKETLSLLNSDETLEKIVKNRRKKASVVSNAKRIIKSALKHLPQALYLKIKTKLR